MEADREFQGGADNPAFQADEPAPPPYTISSEDKADSPKDDTDSEGGDGRQQWGNGLEFLMSCIAMSVGLGNVWRFPFTAYENGGGAFLIPYIIVLIIIGRPLYYLEMGLGQFTNRGCVKIWNMAPALRGVGFGQIGATACVLSYYMSLMALTLFYLAMSFNETLPWTECRDEWTEPCVPSGSANASSVDTGEDGVKPRTSAELYFVNYVLREKSSLEDGLGDIDWRLMLCLLASWIVVFGVVIRGVQSSGKAAYFLALFPYVIMIVLLVRGVTLTGAGKGILFFITPQWEKLASAQVWYAAVTQAFFSLNVGFGSLINYASYNNFRHNIYRDAMIVTTLDTFTSLLAGCTIFAILGNLAYEMGEDDIEEVVKSGAGLAFISYPDAIAKFDAVPQLFAVLFFLMLLTLAVGSAVALVSAIVTIILDNFRSFKPWIVNTVVCVSGFAIGLVYVTQGGQWILTLVDHFGATYPVLALMCVETVGVAWLYGVDSMCADLAFMLKRSVGAYWRLTWGLITPVFLIVVFVYALVQDEPIEYAGNTFPDHHYVVGWLLMGFLVALCPVFIIYEIGSRMASHMSFKEAFVTAFLPSPAWGPSNRRVKEEWKLDRRELQRRAEAAQESCGKSFVRKVCGCGTLPILAQEDYEDPKKSP